jgi:prepilin-type processing-associated H-X9-DG protein
LVPVVFAVSWIVAYALRPRTRWQVLGVGMGAILTALLFTNFTLLLVNAKGKSPQTMCMGRLKSLHALLSEYATKHEGELPPAEGWRQAVQPYAGDHVEDVTVCPSTSKPYVLSPLLAGRALKAVRDPERAPLVWDDPDRMHVPHRPAFNVCFADGHVQGFVPSMYKEIITGQKGEP